MLNKKSFGVVLLMSALLLPSGLSAQVNSLNTYSPYTFYGLGNLNYTGTTNFALMGGASIGHRNETNDLRVNTTNPAALSSIPQRTFFFDLGMTGTNIYLQQHDPTENNLLRKTSFNTLNISNITVGMPLTRKLGLAINVAPFSEVGYRIQKEETDPAILADLGTVMYYYNGEGDITEAKASVGWEPFKGFSIGAELIYLWGNIDRSYQAVIQPYTGSGQYNGVSAYTNEKVSRIFGGFGLQYTPVVKEKSRLTIGATYRLGGRLNSTVVDYIPSGNIYEDIVRLDTMASATHMPQTIGAGIFFHRPKYSIGFDYIYQDWARNNTYDEANQVGYTNTHTFKLGVQYTPNRYDIRSFFKRNTYRLGFRYNDYYLRMNGHKLNEKAVTFGVDIPFKMMTVSGVNIGVELGERGTLQHNLIRERYWKVNVGVMLFGRDYDYWFEKYKYN